MSKKFKTKERSSVEKYERMKITGLINNLNVLSPWGYIEAKYEKYLSVETCIAIAELMKCDLEKQLEDKNE